MENGASSYRRFREDGDDEGLAEIIRNYKDGLVFYINSFTNNVRLSEELAIETFVLLGTKKPKDKGKGSFKTWLYTIARNLTFDYLRKEKRKSARETSLDEINEIIRDENSLEKSYIKKETSITLHRAMRKLKPEYKEVLWLIYFEDLSCKEIALMLKKSTHNIETLAYRARNSLKEILEKEGFTYENL